MLLGSSKAQVDAQLGRPVMASSVLDMTSRGEKAFAYKHGADDIIVGFFDDVARYIAVAHNGGPKNGFSPAEIASILALNAPSTLWKKETAKPAAAPKSSKVPAAPLPPPDSYYSFSDPKLKSEVLGWEPGGKPFLFFFVPSWPGQLPLVLNEWQVGKALT